MKKHVIFLLFCLISAGVFGQNYRLAGKKIENGTHPALQKNFEQSAVYQVSVDDLFLFAQKNQKGFGMELEFTGLPTLNVQLQPSGLLAEGYTTIIAEESGTKTSTERSSILPFISKAKDGKTAKAALTVAPGFLYGLFSQGGQTWYIEPLWYYDNTQAHDLFVVYESADVLPVPGNFCAKLEAHHELETANDRTNSTRENCGPPELELAIASDYKMVLKYGSVNNVLTHNVGVMNDAQANWDDEFSTPVMFKIVAQFVPASQSADPFPSTTNIANLIAFFDTWANAGGFGTLAFDLGHLRATRDFDGGALGAAYTGQLCTAHRFGVLSDKSLSACGLRTVVSHEMGHSFGASHNTDIMGAVYTGCTNTWSATSVAQINALLGTWPCLTPSASCPLPNFVPMPIELSEICTGIEECVTLPDNPCVASYSVTNNDPNLQITVTGNTICIKSTLEASRSTYAVVTPLDYCGNPPIYNPSEPSAPWIIRIDGHLCGNFSGSNSDNRSGSELPFGLAVYQSQDVLIIEDFDIILRNKDISIFNMNGQLLLQQQSSGSLQQISLSNMPIGMLIVKVNAGNLVVTKRVFKL